MKSILKIYHNIDVCIFGRRRHLWVYKSSKKPKSQVVSVQRETEQSCEFQTKLLETIMVKVVSAIVAKVNKKIDYKYNPKYK